MKTETEGLHYNVFLLKFSGNSMFKTHDSMSVPIMRAFSGRHSYWSMIERDSKDAWFYVTLEYRVDGQLIIRTFMPDNAQLLVRLLSEKSRPLRVKELQVVLPPKLSKMKRWLMEPLAKIESAIGEDEDELLIYTTTTGVTYVDPPQRRHFDPALAKRTTLYDAVSESL